MNLAMVLSEFRERVPDDGKKVSLAGMQLAEVPEWLGNLAVLTTLDLGGNQLTASPVRLADLLAGGLHVVLKEKGAALLKGLPTWSFAVGIR